MHWEMASMIARSRENQLEREAARRRRIRKDAAASNADAEPFGGPTRIDLITTGTDEARPECRPDAD